MAINSDTIHHHHTDATDIFGFWIYILSDCILFATIFAVYAALNATVTGSSELKAIIHLPYVLIETMVLLTSSLTYGLAILASYQPQQRWMVTWLGVTMLLGTMFVGMELNEFIQMYHEGYSWHHSASLSAFYTLVGTHGLHVFFGLMWMLVLVIQLRVFGLTPMMRRRLGYLALFWTFLDIIWIFVYTVVYLMGAI